MSDANRLRYLRVALTVVGLIFIFGIYTLGIVWPSGWVWGAVAGGLFLQFWPDIAGIVSRNLVHPVFGGLLVLSMRFMPNGVAGAVSVWRWLATWARRKPARAR